MAVWERGQKRWHEEHDAEIRPRAPRGTNLDFV